MSAPARSVPLLVSTLFGVLMVLAAAGTTRGPGWIAAGVALAAVAAGAVHRGAAPVAVLVTAAVLVIANAPGLVAAVCGLSASAYLITRHAAAITAPTLLGMAGCTAVALTAAALPWRLAWVPLLAPAIALGIVALAGTGLFRQDPVRYE